MPINTSGPLEKKDVSFLYGGDIVLEFAKTGHRYKVFHKGVPKLGTKGVTTVIGIIYKPELLAWTARMTNEAWVSGLTSGPVDELTIVRLAKEAPLAWRNKRDSAGDLGTLIHAWIESYINGKVKGDRLPGTPVNQTIQIAAQKFVAWEKENVAKFIASEKKLYSLKHNIAGTCDFIYVNKKGELSIGDIKTSKGIYETFAIQLAAYKYMLTEEMKYTDPNATLIYKNMTIVRVGKDDGEIEVKEISDYKKHVMSFLACVILHNNLRSKN